MKTSEFLAQLKSLSVRVWAEGLELRCSAPKGVLGAELKRELSARKAEILLVLAEAAPALAPETPLAGLSAALPERERPLSFAQQRLWFLQRLDPELAAYNIPMSWTLSGPLDAAALERALAEVVRRHQVLRTRFPTHAGRPYPEVFAPEALGLERWARPEGDDGAWRTEVVRRLEARAAEPFDLESPSLFRPLLVELGPSEHVLFCLVHHAVFDGGSIARFLKELGALYAAFAAGRPSPLAEPEVQYADFAVWQQGALQGPAYARELAHWRAALAGELPVLELPFDRPRPPVQTFRGAKARLALAPALVQRLGELAGREGASLFMAALAAYKALLARTTGVEDVIVATPIDSRGGRARPELADAIGFYAGTLVLRSRLDGNPTFRELLARVRGTCLAAFEHQSLPFERLVDKLAPERNLAYTPLFQTLFLIEEGVGVAERMGALEVTPFALETKVARADLMLYLYRERSAAAERGAGLERWSVWAEYNTDLFDPETIEALLARYVRLLEAVAANPEVRLAAIELTTEAERRTLLEDWNATAAALREVTLTRLIEEQVDRAPPVPALCFPGTAAGLDRRLGYAELEREANRLAHYLVARAVKPGDLVGLCLERSSEMLIGLFAILKCGAAYVPLDPAFPAERLAYMVADAGLRLVVTTAELAGLAGGAQALCLDRERAAIAACSDARPAPAPGRSGGPRERCYVIYTSGSTGKPKGVEIEHRSVVNFLASMQRELGLGQGDSILAVTTLSFDIAVLELWLPLVTGGTAIVASRAQAASGTELGALLGRLRPSAMQATPATWRMLLTAGWEGDPELAVLCGGEALPPDLAHELARRGRTLVNLYGPTETTVWSTLARIEPASSGRIPIGRPIANTRVYVLDGSGSPQPAGVPGELWNGGAGLARGYLGRPELTAERFAPDPFAPEPLARRYRTGDLARWRRDGLLECLGRIDSQVKLRGFRIELGEIEAVLAEEPLVRACAVLVREDRPGDQRLVAYCEGTASPERLRERARAFLPGYMVPQAFVTLAALPLSPSGKVDRRALAALPAEPEAALASGAAPRNELEQSLVELWSAALGTERVPTDANFFDLGGHSLLLAELQVRLQEELEVDVSIVEMFQYPTVAGLAAHLERGRSAGTGAENDQRRRRSRNLTSGRRALRQRRGTRE